MLKGNLGVALGEMQSRYPAGAVMAVDNQPIMRQFYNSALQTSRMKLDFHSSPLTALDALRSGRKPDAIFSDIEMSVMTGFEFMEAVMKVYENE